MNTDCIDRIKFDDKGLVPAIIQEEGTGTVLMLAYMNRESLAMSIASGYTHFWSRSRQSFWKKGESSGHVQQIRAIHWDCDADTLLVTVRQTGVACHTGEKSCFDCSSPYSGCSWTGAPGGVLASLEALVADRRANPRQGSYTNRLLADPGLAREKVVEEAAEVAKAARSEGAERLVSESADLLYHLVTLLAAHDLSLDDVTRELARRHGNPPRKG
jgi:phosphoribosyl-ATP pyrophosphohydrolase/phosphoribosyl-AMP cyclohydrolase